MRAAWSRACLNTEDAKPERDMSLDVFSDVCSSVTQPVPRAAPVQGMTFPKVIDVLLAKRLEGAPVPLDFSQAFGARSPPLPPNLPRLLSVSSPSRGLSATRLTLNSGHFSLSFLETLSIVLASSQIPTLIPCSLYSYNFSTDQGDPKQTYLVCKLLLSVTALFLPAPLLPEA